MLSPADVFRFQKHCGHGPSIIAENLKALSLIPLKTNLVQANHERNLMYLRTESDRQDREPIFFYKLYLGQDLNFSSKATEAFMRKSVRTKNFQTRESER